MTRSFNPTGWNSQGRKSEKSHKTHPTPHYHHKIETERSGRQKEKNWHKDLGIQVGYSIVEFPEERGSRRKKKRKKKKKKTGKDARGYEDNLAKCLFQIHPTCPVESSWFLASQSSPFSAITSKISPGT